MASSSMLVDQDCHNLSCTHCTTSCGPHSFLGCNSVLPPVMQVESTSIGWSLGYMLTMSNMIPSDVKKIPPMTDPLFAGLIFLFSALTIVTVVFIFIIIIRTCYWGRTPPVGGHNPRGVAHWQEQERRHFSWTQRFAGISLWASSTFIHLYLSVTALCTIITHHYCKALNDTCLLYFILYDS